jgi:dihydrofolate reductase
MRKVILFIASSLDGYIARQSGDIDWLFTDQDYGYSESFASVDTILMGRKTYKQVFTFGEYPYKGVKCN